MGVPWVPSTWLAWWPCPGETSPALPVGHAVQLRPPAHNPVVGDAVLQGMKTGRVITQFMQARVRHFCIRVFSPGDFLPPP